MITYQLTILCLTYYVLAPKGVPKCIGRTGRVRRRRCRGDAMWKRGVHLPTGGGVWGGENVRIFHLKWHDLMHIERHFCQEMLAGYRDYDTM